MYWSTKDARRRCVYTCRVVEVRPQALKSPTVNIKDMRIVHDSSHPDFVPLSTLDLSVYGINLGQADNTSQLSVGDLSAPNSSVVDLTDTNMDLNSTRASENTDLDLEGSLTHSQSVTDGSQNQISGEKNSVVLECNRRLTSEYKVSEGKPMPRSASFTCLPSKVSENSRGSLSSSWPQSRLKANLSVLSPNTLKMLNIKDPSKYLKPLSEEPIPEGAKDDELQLLKIADRLNSAAAKSTKRGDQASSQPFSRSPSVERCLSPQVTGSFSPIPPTRKNRSQSFDRISSPTVISRSHSPMTSLLGRLPDRPFSPPSRMLERSRSLSVEKESLLAKSSASTVHESQTDKQIDSHPFLPNLGSDNTDGVVLQRGRSVSDPVIPVPEPLGSSSPVTRKHEHSPEPIDNRKLVLSDVSTLNESSEPFDVESSSNVDSSIMQTKSVSDFAYSASGENSSSAALTAETASSAMTDVSITANENVTESLSEATPESDIAENSEEYSETIVVMTDSGESLSEEDAIRIVQEVLERQILEVEKQAEENSYLRNEEKSCEPKGSQMETDTPIPIKDKDNEVSMAKNLEQPLNAEKCIDEVDQNSTIKKVVETIKEAVEKSEKESSKAVSDNGNNNEVEKPASPFIPHMINTERNSAMEAKVRTVHTRVRLVDPGESPTNVMKYDKDKISVTDNSFINNQELNRTGTENAESVSVVSSDGGLADNDKKQMNVGPDYPSCTSAKDDVKADTKVVEKNEEVMEVDDAKVVDKDDSEVELIAVDPYSSDDSDILDITESVVKSVGLDEVNKVTSEETMERKECFNKELVYDLDESIDSDIEVLDDLTDTRNSVNHDIRNTEICTNNSGDKNNSNCERTTEDEIDGDHLAMKKDEIKETLKTKHGENFVERNEELREGEKTSEEELLALKNGNELTVPRDMLVESTLDESMKESHVDQCSDSVNMKRTELPVLDPISKKIKEESIAKSCPGEKGPFKCSNCRRMYRTESSYKIHVENCTFCLSSSDEDSNSLDSLKAAEQFNVRVTRSKRRESSECTENLSKNVRKKEVQIKKEKIQENSTEQDEFDGTDEQMKKVRSSLRQSTVYQRVALEAEAKRIKEENSPKRGRGRPSLNRKVDIDEHKTDETCPKRGRGRQLSNMYQDTDNVETVEKSEVVSPRRGRGRPSLMKVDKDAESSLTMGDNISSPEQGQGTPALLKRADDSEEVKLAGEELPKRGRGRPVAHKTEYVKDESSEDDRAAQCKKEVPGVESIDKNIVDDNQIARRTRSGVLKKNGQIESESDKDTVVQNKIERKMTRSKSHDSNLLEAQSDNIDGEREVGKHAVKEERAKLADMVNRKRAMNKISRSESQDESDGEGTESPVPKKSLTSVEEQEQANSSVGVVNDNSSKSQCHSRRRGRRRRAGWRRFKNKSENSVKHDDQTEHKEQSNEVTSVSSDDSEMLDPVTGHIVSRKTGEVIRSPTCKAAEEKNEEQGEANQSQMECDTNATSELTDCSTNDTPSCNTNTEEKESEHTEKGDEKDSALENEKRQEQDKKKITHEQELENADSCLSEEKDASNTDSATGVSDQQEAGSVNGDKGKTDGNVDVASDVTDGKGSESSSGDVRNVFNDSNYSTTRKDGENAKTEERSDNEVSSSGMKSERPGLKLEDTGTESDDKLMLPGNLPGTVLQLLKDGHKVVIKNPKFNKNYVWQKTENGYVGKPFDKPLPLKSVKTVLRESEEKKQAEKLQLAKTDMDNVQCTEKADGGNNQTKDTPNVNNVKDTSSGNNINLVLQSPSNKDKDVPKNSVTQPEKNKSVSQLLFEKLKNKKLEREKNIAEEVKPSEAPSLTASAAVDSKMLDLKTKAVVQNIANLINMDKARQTTVSVPAGTAEYIGGVVLSQQKAPTVGNSDQVISNTIPVATFALQNSIQLQNQAHTTTVRPKPQQSLVSAMLQGSVGHSLLPAMMGTPQLQYPVIHQQSPLVSLNQLSTTGMANFVSTPFNNLTPAGVQTGIQTVNQPVPCMPQPVGNSLASVAALPVLEMGMMAMPVQTQLPSQNGHSQALQLQQTSQGLQPFLTTNSMGSLSVTPGTCAPLKSPVLQFQQTSPVIQTVTPLFTQGNPQKLFGTAESGFNRSTVPDVSKSKPSPTLSFKPPNILNTYNRNISPRKESEFAKPSFIHRALTGELTKPLVTIKPGLGGGSLKLYEKMKSLMHKRNRITAKKAIERKKMQVFGGHVEKSLKSIGTTSTSSLFTDKSSLHKKGSVHSLKSRSPKKSPRKLRSKIRKDALSRLYRPHVLGMLSSLYISLSA